MAQRIRGNAPPGHVQRWDPFRSLEQLQEGKW
jgi:hypothetical protein